MDRPQFKPRRLRPMQPAQYRKAAATLRRMADRIEATAEADGPLGPARRARAVFTAMRFARDLWRRDQRFDMARIEAAQRAELEAEIESRVAEWLAQRSEK